MSRSKGARRFDPLRLALVAFEQPAGQTVTDRELSPIYPAHGLTFSHKTPGGSAVELIVQLPDQLDTGAYFALEDLALLKPAVLPLDLISAKPGQVHTLLRTDAAARAAIEPFTRLNAQAAEIGRLKRELQHARDQLSAQAAIAGTEVRTTPDTSPPLAGTATLALPPGQNERKTT